MKQRCQKHCCPCSHKTIHSLGRLTQKIYREKKDKEKESARLTEKNNGELKFHVIEREFFFFCLKKKRILCKE